MTNHDGLVIFDCDGVLIDSEAIACRTISETLVQFGITMTPREALDAYVGTSEKDVRADLRERGLDDYDKFAEIWRDHLWVAFANDLKHVARPKPAPDLVLHCLSQFNALSEKSVMIDDSSHGIQAALAAGVTTIGFVDPNDPRPNRQKILQEAGAEIIATGADDLLRALQSLSVSFRGTTCQK